MVLGAPSKESREATSKQLFNFGFGRTASFTPRAAPAFAQAPPAPASKPAAAATGAIPKVVTGSGNAGVQFGAFSTEQAARNHQARIRSVMGIDTVLEHSNGLVRVRARMSEVDANRIRGECGRKGVECFVFRG